MDWQDQGIILTTRAHGESAAIIDVLTEQHGRHAGLVRGGQSRKQKGILQPGNHVRVIWRGRLAEHLGSFQLEALPGGAYAATVLTDRIRLAALVASCSLLKQALPEREPHGAIYAAFTAWLDLLSADNHWQEVLVRLELGLLKELGFALDLNHCAVTGQTDDLAYVSPKSGRAVSREAGAEYADRLFPLPSFLGGVGKDGAAVDGLKMTAHFLNQSLFRPNGQELPEARARLVHLLGG